MNHSVFICKMSNTSPPFDTSFLPEKEDCFYVIGGAWRKNNLTETSHVFSLLVSVTAISITTVLPTILSNSLVIFTVTTRPRLQNNANILLACLASTDLFGRLVTGPMHKAINHEATPRCRTPLHN